MPTFKIGDLVLFMSVRCGMVPCKVIGVGRDDWDRPKYALSVTAKRHAYERGHIIESTFHWVRPRKH